MARRRKEDQPIGVGMTAKQMKRKKPISLDLMRDIEPLTDNQKLLFGAYEKGQHIVAYGCAGTGKTFITLYNALQDVLDQSDLIKTNERNGIVDFMKVLRLMPSIDIIEFGVDDIVRSGFVKEYILAKMEVGV